MYFISPILIFLHFDAFADDALFAALPPCGDDIARYAIAARCMHADYAAADMRAAAIRCAAIAARDMKRQRRRPRRRAAPRYAMPRYAVADIFFAADAR